MQNGFVRKAAGTAAIAGVLAWAAWRYGLFFEADAYPVELALLAAGALLALLGLVWTRTFIMSPMVLFPLGIAACYGITYLAGPASAKGTVDAMLRWSAYACWLALLLAWWRKPQHRVWGEAAVQAVGVFLLAGGWLGWFGVLHFPEIVLRFDDPQLSATGARLAGFMQYPNAFGAVLAFFLVRQWQGWAGRGKWAAGFASLTSIPYAGALVLTESRGSWVVLLIGLAMAWWFAGDSWLRNRLLLGAGITGAGAAFAARGAWLNSVGGDGLTALGIVAGAAVMYGLWRWSETKWTGTGFSAWWSAVILMAGASALVWAVGTETGGGRISGNYGTAASRILFYKDGWQMFKDSPWIGYGGHSWRMLFGLYQRQPYVGGEVHSGYLDAMLDTGLAGLILFLAMLGLLVWKVWKARRQALAPASVLLVHAAVDFDWSYGWMWLLLFAWLALSAESGDGGRAAGARLAAGWRRAGGRVAAVLLLGASAWSGWAAWHSLAAVRSSSAADTAATPAAREAELRAALEANPAWSRIRLALAPLLPEAGERESVLAAGLRYEPQSAPLLLQLGLAEAELGHVAQAEERLREALRLERFSREGQTAAVAGMARAAESLAFAGRAEDARRSAQAAVSFYQRYRQLVRSVAALDHPANGERFGMTASALYNAADAYRMLGRVDQARPLLRILLEGDDDNWREQARQLLDQLDAPSR